MVDYIKEKKWFSKLEDFWVRVGIQVEVLLAAHVAFFFQTTH